MDQIVKRHAGRSVNNAGGCEHCRPAQHFKPANQENAR